MLEALKPENFDKVAAAARIIAGYDETTKIFQTPSLAIHLRTTLLAVCLAAKTLILKKRPCSAYYQLWGGLEKCQKLSSWLIQIGNLKWEV
ncbi:hypothetical protein NQ314_014209 [Rhamnusium bicolor]|uniref:Uncharacterized protein n=1 Tax=Rhamnusium bicolor TaxID=1586634 RepID=A0AAV8X2E9_9CUCU|nr:hypothetical protein NQ314_014209 [Rhamnusium bicolor]